jgi:arginine repressor
MAKISKEMLRKLISENFFDNFKSIEEIVERLDQKGFSISGKKISLLSQLLTFLCQEEALERKKDEKGRWAYKKV